MISDAYIYIEPTNLNLITYCNVGNTLAPAKVVGNAGCFTCRKSGIHPIA